jgi:hypothetical protein
MKKKLIILILSFLIFSLIGYIEFRNNSQSDSYKKCINETILPEESYIKGEVIVVINQESTNDEINKFNDDFNLEENIKLMDYYYEIRDRYNVNIFPVYERENKSLEMGGKPAQEFINYLNSFPVFVKSTFFDYNQVNNLIIVYFYKNVSLEDSEKLIKNYEKFGDFDSLELFNRVSTGLKKVPENQEIEWICRFKEEKIVESAFVRILINPV